MRCAQPAQEPPPKDEYKPSRLVMVALDATRHSNEGDVCSVKPTTITGCEKERKQNETKRKEEDEKRESRDVRHVAQQCHKLSINAHPPYHLATYCGPRKSCYLIQYAFEVI
ncbi:unnamed protein product [Toxocara canis]|uniref:Uncharacterized protein n=1 Tax=Toxocara canis TaxID=6265 RepID=A0A183V2F0_TOXCA|nr:unnamed protein product [Toxocara canis]